MAIPADIEDWILRNRPCAQGAERLSQYASMWHAWEASTHGFFLQYIVQSESRNTPGLKALKKRWRPPCHSAMRRARRAHPTAPSIELQTLFPELGEALGMYASQLKRQVPNPFRPPSP